ncbi:MAG: hypothetical protein KC506_03290 [Nanoarchaeota archaeon]|nr:hypothetical protein [Nanoarchaeota archaeon]
MSNGAVVNDTGNFTVSAWIKTTDETAGTIVSDYYFDSAGGGFTDNRYGWVFGVGGTGGSNVYYNGYNNGAAQAAATGDMGVANGEWIHVAVSVVDRNASIYVNGTLMLSQVETLPGSNANRKFRLGVTDGSFNGSIDEVLVFNRALDSSEIGSLYDASATQYGHNFSSLAVGNYTFTGYAVDAQGNKNQTEERVVEIEDAPLTVSFTTATPSDGEILFTDSIYVGVNVYNIGDEDTIKFNLYGAGGDVSNSSSFTDGTRNINWTGLAAGNYSFEVIVNETDGSSDSTGNVSVILIDSCFDLSVCSEAGACIVDETCALNNDLCTGGICNFDTLTLEAGKKIYTGYDGSNNGKDLTLNVDSDADPRSPLNFGTGSGFVASGRRGSSHGSGSRGGNGGDVNVTVDDLLNTTNFNITLTGGYTTSSFTSGGDGGNVYLYYHGLIRKFNFGTAQVNLAAGNSFSGLYGTVGGSGASATCVDGVGAGCPYYNRDLTRFPLDPDLQGDGRVDIFDILLVSPKYNLVDSEEDYVLTYDLGGDGEIDVRDLARIGFERDTR